CYFFPAGFAAGAAALAGAAAALPAAAGALPPAAGALAPAAGGAPLASAAGAAAAPVSGVAAAVVVSSSPFSAPAIVAIVKSRFLMTGDTPSGSFNAETWIERPISRPSRLTSKNCGILS